MNKLFALALTGRARTRYMDRAGGDSWPKRAAWTWAKLRRGKSAPQMTRVLGPAHCALQKTREEIKQAKTQLEYELGIDLVDEGTTS